MLEVVVTGISLVSALGKNLVESWQQLLAGKSAIKICQPFPELEPHPLGLIDKQPAQLKLLTQHLVASALQDARLVNPLPNCGVVIGSSRSNQAMWEEMAKNRWEKEMVNSNPRSLIADPRSPENWLDTLPHMNTIAAARQIGATGIVLAPMAACATGIWAIAQAAYLIKSGQCQQVMTGGIEAAITPLTLTGFHKMGALAKTGAYPFDLRREGLVLGEGGAILILESAESAKQRQAKVYGKILSFGLTTDAYHANTPEPKSKSAIAAIKECLQRSHLTPRDIDYIHAHGTATQINDQVESQLIQRLFPQQVAVSSTKGATGHTLGASGALGVAFSLMALQQQILPPCVGLQQPEFDLNLVREAREIEVQRVLCFSFGFGGQNAVMALEKEKFNI
ncbi:beta-ketoacyl synthase [Fischerella sp. NIES-4106]|nr:beta-ketoacyl synthase [Fischerella sp. NIES-4106]